MDQEEQYWQYQHYSGLIFEFPNETIAAHNAEGNDDAIVFVASLYDVHQYPRETEDGKIILGPGVVMDGQTIVFNGQAFGRFPRREGKNTLLGPGITLQGKIVIMGSEMFHKICGEAVVINSSICLKPQGHRSNQHEDADGNTRYA